MGSPDSTDSSVNTSSSSVAISPSPPKKRYDGASSSSMRSSGGGGGKGKTTYPSSHLNGSSTSSSSAHRQRNAKEESYGECSNAMEVDQEDTLKLSKADFPEYNIRHGWQSPPYKVNKGKVQPRVIPPPGKPTKHTNVLEFLWKKVVKMLLKHQHGWPFATPVDTISLPISNYHDIVKRPMDLTTVENRIKHQYYLCGAECIRDIDQIWINCYQFNDPLQDVAIMCKNVENAYKAKLKELPKEEIEIPLKGGYVSRIKKEVVPRGAVNRTESTISTNGLTDDRKRAGDPIVTPVSEKRMRIRNRPMPNYSQMPPKWKGKYTPRMQGCVKIVSDFLTKKSHRLYANPFQAPVDVEVYQLFDYYDVIKKPMDLGSVKKQLDNKLYANVEEFRDDMLLIFQNCFKFNRAGDVVHTAGLQLLEAFDEKFAKLPPETAVTKTPKVRPTSSADNSMASLHSSMPSLNASALFAAVPPSPAVPALDPVPYLTSFMETPKLPPNSLSMPTPSLPAGPIYEACDDDEMIQALMLRIQMQNLVYTEKMSIMQRLSQDLLTLQMHRIAARATNCAAVQPPILSSEAVTRIMHIFEPAQCMPIPIPVLSQSQLDELRSKGLKVGAVPRTVNMPRIIGETPGPSSTAPTSVPPQLAPPVSRAASRASTGSARKSMAPPPTRRAVLSSSDSEYESASVLARRRKKPKAKSIKKEKGVDYTFKSDDESVHAPLSYDEKRVVSMNVQSISPDAVPEILRIIEQRERIPELDYAEEIDFDNLKPVTLRELNALATSLLLSRGQKVYTFGTEPEKEEPPKDSKEGIKTTQPAGKMEAPSASTVFNGFEKNVEPTPTKPSPPKATTAPNPRAELDELKLSSSDSSDSSDSDDSSSSSDSDSDSEDESDSEPEKKVTETFNASSVKAPIANGVSNAGNAKSAEPEAKPKVSPQNSSSTCSPVNVNGFSTSKGHETPRQMNGKPPMSKPSSSSKPTSSLACDPLALLDQPMAPKIEKPALPRNMSSGAAPFVAAATPPRNSYRHLDRVDLSSQISLMANFEENF
uniref:Bromodomain-containing protein 2 n=1 Tax=Panagrellus redivivus TaxID=6233 RepID=A0A7E4V2X9_PANRE